MLFVGDGVGHYLQTGLYLFLYPYQFGITLFVSIIYKIFGVDYMHILLINCACSLINISILFKITKILFKNENIEKIVIILMSIFAIYWMFFNVHFYGNIIGLTFALLATLSTLSYLESNTKKHLILSGISIAIAIILKSNYQIFLCGIILILIFDIIKKWNRQSLLILPIFLFGYFLINFGYSAFLKYNNVILPEGVPMISFVYMGMDEPTDFSPGWYNGVTIELYGDNDFDNKKTSEVTKKLINERLNYFIKNPNEFLNYYSQKIGSTWLNPTFQTIWCSIPGIRCIFNSEYNEYISSHPTILNMIAAEYYPLEENIFNIYQIIIFCFASFGILMLAKTIDLSKALFIIIFAGGFAFHIIWETKAIYVIQYYFLLLPFAAYGLDFFIDEIYLLLRPKN